MAQSDGKFIPVHSDGVGSVNSIYAALLCLVISEPKQIEDSAFTTWLFERKEFAIGL